jgi:hypothetical protein
LCVLPWAWLKPALPCFRKKSSAFNTIGFLAHAIVILVDPADIAENIHDAYSHPISSKKAYSLLMTGPLGSADIGGITVHPAQEGMMLTVIFSPRANDKIANRRAKACKFADISVRHLSCYE